jgi:ELWxxDGT repeat protein
MKSLWLSIGFILFNASYYYAQSFETFDLEASSMANPRQMTYLNHRVLFFGYTDTTGEELWAFDSVSQNVSLVKDIYTGPESSTLGFTEGIVFNNKLFFVATDNNYGTEVWVTDGTPQGTMILKDIASGADSAFPSQFFIFQNKLYFSAFTTNYGQELWVTDGTPQGTVLFKDINPGINGSYPSSFTACQNHFYFTAFHNLYGSELWKTDGTDLGTQLVKDITNDSTDGVYYYPFGPVCLNNKLIFVGEQSSSGQELWVTDGTASGTILLKDIYPGINGSYPSYFTILNNYLLFAADNGTNGQELWKTDGTTAGTILLKDIRSGSNGSYPYEFFVTDTIALFAAESSNNNIELWKTNGTQTVLLKNINPLASSYPERFFAFNNKVFFSADNGTTSKELWVTDGTTDGTQLFKDINTNAMAGSFPHSFTKHNQKFYFIADTGPVNNENFKLFESDGTPGGTNSIAPANAVYNSFNSLFFPFYLTSTPVGLFFKGGFNSSFELWRYYSSLPTTLTNNNPLIKDFWCYPNPFNEKITCNCKTNTPIKVFTLDGKLILESYFTKGTQQLNVQPINKPIIIQSATNSVVLYPSNTK